MRFVILLVIAVIAVVAGVFAMNWSGKKVPNPAAGMMPAQSQDGQTSTVDVLVAKEPIPMGTALTESMIDRQPWPRHLVLESFVISGEKDSDLIGKVARSSFQAREPFSRKKLANPNDPSFLAAQLPSGMRAVTLSTDAISGIAGYVFPGDRVDVLLVHDIPEKIENYKEDKGLGGSKPVLSEVLLPNVRVLAVNVRTADGNQKTINPSSVTVEVSEIGAQMLRLAEKAGTLSLSLRSIKDLENPETPYPTSLEQLTHMRIHTGLDNSSIRIVRGVGKGSKSEVIGGPEDGRILVEENPAPQSAPENMEVQ